MSASLAPECNEVKEYVRNTESVGFESADLSRKYDSCFLKWYSESESATGKRLLYFVTANSEYLRGNSSTDECEPLFKKYKACLSVRVYTRSSHPWFLTLCRGP